MDGWPEDQRRWDEGWERANTCMFGYNCREQLNCAFLHSPEELQLFKDEKELRMKKLRMRICDVGPVCWGSVVCDWVLICDGSERKGPGKPLVFRFGQT